MLPSQLQQALEKIPDESRLLMEAIVVFYETKVKGLEARLKELEDQISKNSRNSSKPPSTDGVDKPNPKSLRKKTGRPIGGQKGHKGTNLKMVATPDTVQRHNVKVCACCQKSLKRRDVMYIERRQVYDIPPLEMKITEHQAEIKLCTCGHVNRADFPNGVNHHVQYGPNIKGLLVYMQDYQLLPYERTKEFVEDLLGHQLSAGTLYNVRSNAFDQLATFEDRLKAVLTAAVVAGFDETGIRVTTQCMWLHSCSTAQHAYYQAHTKRGEEAMNEIGILPVFKGTAVHDFWKSYFQYGCKHGLCNAHLLRELIFIKERFGQDWADELIALLLKMKAAKEKAMDKGKQSLSEATLKHYRSLYDTLVNKGLNANPHTPPPKKKRGRDKKSKPRNLIERFRDYANDILRFLYDFKVPFDNNFSERDLRMMKVKQKISGCFRSFDGAKFFARIRSFIITARKQNVSAFNALKNLFTDNSLASLLTRSEPC